MPPVGTGIRGISRRLGASFADRTLLSAEVMAIAYVAMVAWLASATHFELLLFPELGALAYDIFRRPNGVWARSPVMLVITPFFAGVVGVLVTQWLAFGPVSVALVIGAAFVILRTLSSPIAPALSAGLLPLALGVDSWLYPPALLVGAGGLAAIAALRLKGKTSLAPAAPPVEDLIETPPPGLHWAPVFVLFLALMTLLVMVTGERMLLFPPLVVMANEMLSHPHVCPWARGPWRLPGAVLIIALVGATVVYLLGPTAAAAALIMLTAGRVLAVFDLHAPPAVAVGLIPMVLPVSPTLAGQLLFAAEATTATAILVVTFKLWRMAAKRWRARQLAMSRQGLDR